jgi:hypothetical protein
MKTEMQIDGVTHLVVKDGRVRHRPESSLSFKWKLISIERIE